MHNPLLNSVIATIFANFAVHEYAATHIPAIYPKIFIA
jgi:hypothetical protein